MLHPKLKNAETLEEFKKQKDILYKALGRFEFNSVYGVKAKIKERELILQLNNKKLDSTAIRLSKEYLNKEIFFTSQVSTYFRHDTERRKYIEIQSFKFITPLSVATYNKNKLHAEVIETTYKIGTCKILSFYSRKFTKIFKISYGNKGGFLDLSSTYKFVKLLPLSFSDKISPLFHDLYNQSSKKFLAEIAPLIMEVQDIKKLEDGIKLKHSEEEENEYIKDQLILNFINLLKDKKVTIEDVLPQIKKKYSFPVFKGVELLNLECKDRLSSNPYIFINTNIVNGTGNSDYEPYTTHYYLYQNPEINWSNLLYPIREKLKSVVDLVLKIKKIELELNWNVDYSSPYGYGDASFNRVFLDENSLKKINNLIIKNLK